MGDATTTANVLAKGVNTITDATTTANVLAKGVDTIVTNTTPADFWKGTSDPQQITTLMRSPTDAEMKAGAVIANECLPLNNSTNGYNIDAVVQCVVDHKAKMVEAGEMLNPALNECLVAPLNGPVPNQPYANKVNNCLVDVRWDGMKYEQWWENRAGHRRLTTME